MLLLALLLLALAPGVARANPSLLVIGDSLALDSAPYLTQDLEGWKVRQRYWGGVTLQQGLGWFAQETPPPPIVAFSLFTNNEPSEAPLLERAVGALLARHPGCHIWATPYRRGPAGNVYAAINPRLRAVARRHRDRMVLIDWAAVVTARGGLLREDGVHTTPFGARVRAYLYAGAARRCLRRLRRGAAETSLQRAAGAGREAS